ncbi:hypothetical protein L484_000724 [Morus notabilis]|uniref:O-fucosyltransferase family protein n=1 Tax=Morus notabilis TaxID=981085 RepID=W9SDT2_9ROSA|nr:hypothetical protein L484_000724 [Morus notabilis]
MFVFMGLLFLLDSLMVFIFDSANLQSSLTPRRSSGTKEEDRVGNKENTKSAVHMYDRLLNLASSALAEICNAVAVASLLNATLVLPRFLYSNVWKDPSQFGDIYQEKHFMKIMKDEVDIVKDLPPDLKSIDIEDIGSLITDADLDSIFTFKI